MVIGNLQQRCVQLWFIPFCLGLLPSLSLTLALRSPNFPSEEKLWKAAGMKGISKADMPQPPFILYSRLKPTFCRPADRDLLSHSHTSHSCSISGIFHWSPKLHLVGVDTHCKSEQELTVSSSTSLQQRSPGHWGICVPMWNTKITFWLLWEPQLLISVLMNNLLP